LQVKYIYIIFAELFKGKVLTIMDNKPKKEMSTEVTKANSTEITKYKDFGNMEEMLAYGKQVIKSGLTKLEKPEDVVVAIITGLAIGINPAIAIQQIYPIEGVGTIGVHIITGLLLKAGITYEVLEDYVPLYKYKDSSNNVFEQDEVLQGNYQVVSKGTPKNALIEGKHPVARVLSDRKTVIRFNRQLRRPDGSFAVLVHTETYNLSETPESILKKHNWVNNEKQMVFVACMRRGSRKIADDILNGIMETSEILDTKDINYNMDEIGQVTILNKEGKEIKEPESLKV
jgi:hypothetical protein